MTEPINLREVEQAAHANPRGIGRSEDTLALVALVREARTLISELESVLYSEFQTRNNPCPEARATAWLARVQDEED